MTALDTWLRQATRHLSANSVVQVRAEIQEHFESAREAAMGRGATPDEADGQAVASLGDAKTANRQYRRVLLTSAEAKVLRDAYWECRAVGSRPWLKWLMRAIPVAALCVAAIAFVSDESTVARLSLAVALGIGVFLAAPTLPIHTPFRGRVFRCVKWVGLAAAMWLALGPKVLEMSWMLPTLFWPLFWVEWTQSSLRRKLPVAEWPKHLYL